MHFSPPLPRSRSTKTQTLTQAFDATSWTTRWGFELTRSSQQVQVSLLCVYIVNKATSLSPRLIS